MKTILVPGMTDPAARSIRHRFRRHNTVGSADCNRPRDSTTDRVRLHSVIRQRCRCSKEWSHRYDNHRKLRSNPDHRSSLWSRCSNYFFLGSRPESSGHSIYQGSSSGRPSKPKGRSKPVPYRRTKRWRFHCTSYSVRLPGRNRSLRNTVFRC